MKFDMNNKYTSIAIYAFLVMAGAIGLFYFMKDFNVVKNFFFGLAGLLMPFIYGAVLAYILNPILNWLEHKIFPILFRDKFSKKARRGMGVIFCMLFAIAVVALFLAILIPQISKSVVSLASSFLDWIPKLEMLVSDLSTQYKSNEIVVQTLGVVENSAQNFGSYLQQAVTKGYDLLSVALPNVLGGVMKVTSGLLNWVVGIMICIYLLLSKEIFYAQFKKLLFALLPYHTASGLLRLTHDSNNIFCGFISGKIVDSAIIGVLCFVGCTVLKMPFTLMVSVIVGVTNVIPYFGPFIGAIPSIFIILIADPIKALIFAVFVLVLQQLDGNVIGPKILGDSTGLSAFWVIFSVTFFGGLFGFVGMVIGVPTFAVIYALIRNFAEYRLAFKGMETQTSAYASPENPIFQTAAPQKKKSPLPFHRPQKPKEKVENDAALDDDRKQ